MRKTGDHGGKITVPTPYELEGPATAECPVSLITQKSIELVQIVGTMMSVNKAAGLGGDLDTTPGHLIDALRVIHRETLAIEAKQEEALANS